MNKSAIRKIILPVIEGEFILENDSMNTIFDPKRNLDKKQIGTTRPAPFVMTTLGRSLSKIIREAIE
jgi:hypothetical protein